MTQRVKSIWGFATGTVIGVLGGLMGLGGAEFRLPVLVGLFKFSTIQAIIINLVVSLVTVVFSFIFRSAAIPLSDVVLNYPVIINLLAGSLIGAFLGVKLATKMNAHRLDTIIFIFLLLIGVFMISHPMMHFKHLGLAPTTTMIFGFAAGMVIGTFSSMLGVAGGELIIPTIILLFAIDIKLAGSLSLCVSFPTVLIGITKYRQNKAFEVVKANRIFLIAMAAGSVTGAFIGSIILIGIGQGTLQVVLGIVLLASAIKIYTKRL
jgi:uncharacterized protein